MSINAVSVFCASSSGNDPRFGEMADALGHHLAEAGITLVFGGSDAGLMGRVSNAVRLLESLPALARCDDVEALRAFQPLRAAQALRPLEAPRPLEALGALQAPRD